MGITRLNEFIKKRVKNISTVQSVNILQGKTVALDLFNIMYSIKYKSLKNTVSGTHFMYDEEEGWNDVNRDNLSEDLYVNFTNYIRSLLNNTIKIIVCLDGDTPIEKSNTQESRKKVLENNFLKFKKVKGEAESFEKYRSQLSSLLYIRAEEMTTCINIAQSHGCRVLRPNHEGEALAAKLCKDGEAFAAISTDTDLFAYGCPIIIKKLSNYCSQAPKIEIVDIDDILHYLFNEIPNIDKIPDVKNELMTVLCAICGNDYAPNARNFGVVKCYKLILNNFSVNKFKGSYIHTSYVKLLKYICDSNENFNLEAVTMAYNIFKYDISYEEKENNIAHYSEYLSSILRDERMVKTITYIE